MCMCVCTVCSKLRGALHVSTAQSPPSVTLKQVPDVISPMCCHFKGALHSFYLHQSGSVADLSEKKKNFPRHNYDLNVDVGGFNTIWISWSNYISVQCRLSDHIHRRLQQVQRQEVGHKGGTALPGEKFSGGCRCRPKGHWHKLLNVRHISTGIRQRYTIQAAVLENEDRVQQTHLVS